MYETRVWWSAVFRSVAQMDPLPFEAYLDHIRTESARMWSR